MKKLIFLFGCVIIASIILSSCEFEVTTAHIKDIKTCIYLNGDLCEHENPIFSPNDPQIYVSCKLKNAPENTLVTFVWTYVEGNPIIIDKVTLNSSDYGIDVDLNSRLSQPNSGWPIGSYEVVISIGNNDSSPHIKSFEVR
ncbi:MAG: hypothetical protein QM503_04300 [Bacteroidota bacterium]